MRQPRPSWLYPILLAAVLCAAAAEASNTVGIPGAERPGELVMNEFPVLPPDARKKFDITAHDPATVAELGVVDFFQLVADVLKMNIVIGDRSKLENRKVGIVIRDMTIEEALRLVLQMNDLKAVHFNDNTVIVMDRASRADFGVKQPRRFRLRYTTIDKVREFVNLNPSIGRQLGTAVTFDATTNSIIAIDNPENLRLIEEVLGQLDVPPMKILEAVKLSYIDLTRFSTLARTLGQDIVSRLATIGLSYNQDARALMVYGTPEDVALIRNLAEKFDVAPKQVLIDTAFLQVSESFNREFGFKFTNSSITVNQFDRVFNLSRIREQNAGPPPVFPTRTQINYLISKTGAKTLQSPKVRALDNTPATINVGEIRNIQIQSTATTLGTGVTPGQQQTTFNTQEVPIGVQVNVTPQIHNDDSVTLDMRISVTKVLEIKSFGVDRTTQDSTTKLRIRNGETVVLGGFINQVLNSDDTPIPVIGEVPLLDKIFRNKKRERTDSELVFLLTPYILDFQERSPNKAPCEEPLPAKKTVAVQETVTTTTTTTVEDEKLGDHGPSKADERAAGKGTKAAPAAVASVEVRTTRVLEGKTGSTKIVLDGDGQVVSKEFQPKKAGWTQNPKDAKLLEVSQVPPARDAASVSPRSKRGDEQAVVSNAQVAAVYESAGEAAAARKHTALSPEEAQTLRRIASIARKESAPARARIVAAAASAPAPEESNDAVEPVRRYKAVQYSAPPKGPSRASVRPEPAARQPSRRAPSTELRTGFETRPLRRSSGQIAPQAEGDSNLETAPEPKSHPYLEKLRAERKTEEAASFSAAGSHPELKKLREERLAEETLAGAPRAKAAPARVVVSRRREVQAVAALRAMPAGAEAVEAPETRRAHGSASVGAANSGLAEGSPALGARALGARPGPFRGTVSRRAVAAAREPNVPLAEAEDGAIRTPGRAPKPAATETVVPGSESVWPEERPELSTPAPSPAEGVATRASASTELRAGFGAPVGQPEQAVVRPRPASRKANATPPAKPVRAETDRQLIERLKAMTAKPVEQAARPVTRETNVPARAPAVRARPVRANAVAHDRALIARLEQLSKSKPAPAPVPAAVVFPGGPKPSKRPEPELASGTGFDELARSLEADLGRM